MLSLYAKGLTTGEISAHFAEIYGASVSKETVSRVTLDGERDLRNGGVRDVFFVVCALKRAVKPIYTAVNAAAARAAFEVGDVRPGHGGVLAVALLQPRRDLVALPRHCVVRAWGAARGHVDGRRRARRVSGTQKCG